MKKHKMFLVFSRQGAQDISVASFFFYLYCRRGHSFMCHPKQKRAILVASTTRWDEHLTMLMILKRECWDFSEASEHLSEKTRIVGYSDGGQDECAESRT